MKRLVCLAFLLLAICSCAVFGAPDVVKDRFVYTVPAGFNPPLIGKSGIAEIQNAAAKLRYPYYVVLVERFDGETDQDAADYIDSLAEKWQQDPDFNSAKSCIFMLSYEPRKYRFIAGSRWEHELGFGPDAHRPYNAIFEGYVGSSRKDPKTGIIRMMQAVDRYLIHNTDPKIIAARKEAARKAELARKEAEKKALEESALQMARDQLSNEASTLDALLASSPRFLPKDISEYVSARDSANAVASRDNRPEILGEAASLHLLNIKLGAFVENKERIAHGQAMRFAANAGSAAAAFIILLTIVILRARRYSGLKRSFEQQSRDLEEKVLNAQPKYLTFDQERGMILGLRELSGRTKEVYESTTREVDDIFITIGALQNHIDNCRTAARRGSFWNTKPLERAISILNSQFTIDTNQLNTIDLFAPETRQVTLKSSEAVAQLEERFQRAIEQWNHLKKAAEIRMQQAEDVFPQNKLDEMLKKADERSIPHRWLADHPLFGDDASDQTLYTTVNEGRWNDPVAFLERLEELQAKEAEVADRLNRLIKSIEVAKSQHIDSTPDFATTVLQPQDDPRVTFDAARREEARFNAMLASRSEVTEVEAQAETVRNLYRQCVEQTLMVKEAIAGAEGEVEQARNQLKDVSSIAQYSEQQVRERETIHSNMSGVIASLNNAARYLDAGRVALDSATILLSEKEHLDAQNAARQSKAQLTSATQEYNHCRKQWEELDEAKRLYESRLNDLQDRQQQYESQIHRYGGSVGRLRTYQRPQIASAVDYLMLLNQIDTLQSSWEEEVRRARRTYEEMERRRREEEEEEDRRRRNSDSGFGSSSGGGWGGSSSSSSSGGSWSSSSSSSSSSSGGSW